MQAMFALKFATHATMDWFTGMGLRRGAYTHHIARVADVEVAENHHVEAKVKIIKAHVSSCKVLSHVHVKHAIACIVNLASNSTSTISTKRMVCKHHHELAFNVCGTMVSFLLCHRSE